MHQPIEVRKGHATVYVPSWRFDNRLIAHLLDVAGGCTISTGFGMWRNEADAVESEDVHLIDVWYPEEAHMHVGEALKRIAESLHKIGERCVMVVVNGAALMYYAE